MSMACGGKDRPRCLIESRSSVKVAMALEIVTASACVTCFWANRSQDRSHDAMISGLRCPDGFNAPASVHTWHKALTRLCTASGASGLVLFQAQWTFPRLGPDLQCSASGWCFRIDLSDC